MARCHQPGLHAAVNRAAWRKVQRQGTPEGHRSHLPVEKGMTHIRLSFVRRLYAAIQPGLIQTPRNANWTCPQMHSVPSRRYAMPLLFSNLPRCGVLGSVRALRPGCRSLPEVGPNVVAWDSSCLVAKGLPITGENSPSHQQSPPGDVPGRQAATGRSGFGLRRASRFLPLRIPSPQSSSRTDRCGYAASTPWRRSSCRAVSRSGDSAF